MKCETGSLLVFIKKLLSNRVKLTMRATGMDKYELITWARHNVKFWPQTLSEIRLNTFVASISNSGLEWRINTTTAELTLVSISNEITLTCEEWLNSIDPNRYGDYDEHTYYPPMTSHDILQMNDDRDLCIRLEARFGMKIIPAELPHLRAMLNMR